MGADQAAPASLARAAATRRGVRRLGLFPYLCLAPAAIITIVFLYYPAVSAFGHAFTDWDGANPPSFIGLGNFQQMLVDPQMQIAFANALKFTGFSLAVELTVPLAVAKMILAVRHTRFQHVMRVLFLLPLIVPLVVMYLLWQFIYDPNVGLLNALLAALHLGGTQDWLGDPQTALYALMVTGAGIVASFPFVDGFGLLIYTAGLQSIPAEMLESAQLDGAGAWARFWRIEVPLILGQLRLMSVLTIIAGIQQFTAVLILTGGGPGSATTVPGFSLYNNAFLYNRLGYACAIGVVLFAITVILAAINFRFLRPSTEFDAREAR